MNASRVPVPILLVLLLSNWGCAVGMSSTHPADAPARAASETPERFLVGTIPLGGALSEPQANMGCRNPMVDPRDGTVLNLAQSQRGTSGEVGDYTVPDGRYGVRSGELLRLDCSTGRVIGIVPSRARA
jgi:hypothetical protein